MIDGLLILEPKERLSVEGALNHPWIKHYERYEMHMCLSTKSTTYGFGCNSLPTAPLESTVEELKKFMAKRKFRGAVKVLHWFRQAPIIYILICVDLLLDDAVICGQFL